MGFGSFYHWLIVLLIVVLLFGSKKIPELAKSLGSGIKNFKKGLREGDEVPGSGGGCNNGSTVSPADSHSVVGAVHTSTIKEESSGR